MERRTLISAAVALGVAGVMCGCARVSSEQLADALPQATLAPLPVTEPGPQVIPFDPARINRQPVPGGPIYDLPDANSDVIAWTVDDGFGDQVTQAYARFVADSGVRMTFFVCAESPGWSHSAPVLRPLVESGQVQIANHTRTHSNLLNLSDAEIQQDLLDNNALIGNLFGVDSRPYFRPPFGNYDDRVAAAAAAVGYTVPVLWNGTLSDAGEIPPETLMSFADRYMRSGVILLGHANFWPVTVLYPRLVGVLEERNLMTVTLNDIYGA